MAEPRLSDSALEIQRAVDTLANCEPEQQPAALEQLGKAIFKRYGHPYSSSATSELFSKELRNDIQRFSAVWLLRILTRSPGALQSQFQGAERLTADLFDQVFRQDVYQRIGINTGAQTYEKIKALTDHLQTKLDELETLTTGGTNLHQLSALQKSTLQLLNDKSIQPFLIPLFSRPLITIDRIRNLFGTVMDYVNNEDTDPIHRRDAAYEACDDFVREAQSYGTADADRILGGLARRLKSAVTHHFDSLEASQQPCLELSPIAKKYPLARPGTNIVLKVRIANNGTGAARDLRMDEIISDDCLLVGTSETTLGTIQPGQSFVFDLLAKVAAPSPKADLLVSLSWARLGARNQGEYPFTVKGSA